jgi:hypothetical protein
MKLGLLQVYSILTVYTFNRARFNILSHVILEVELE